MKTTLDRAPDPGRLRPQERARPDRRAVETPDPNTVVIKLKKPFAPLTAALADRAGMIISPGRGRKLGDELRHRAGLRRPVQVRQPGRAGLASRWSRTRNYYDAAKVHLDAIDVPDHRRRQHPLQQPALRRRAGADARRPTQDVDALQKDTQPDRAAVAVARLPGHHDQPRQRRRRRQRRPSRSTRPIAKDPRVRQAFELSLDREACQRRSSAACTRPPAGRSRRRARSPPTPRRRARRTTPPRPSSCWPRPA